jgi:hypothetical protein
MANSLSMYSITENIYCWQLSSVAILLQPEPVSHRIVQGRDCVRSPSVLSSCDLLLHPTCLLVTVNEARSYFASTIQDNALLPQRSSDVISRCTEPMFVNVTSSTPVFINPWYSYPRGYAVGSEGVHRWTLKICFYPYHILTSLLYL